MQSSFLSELIIFSERMNHQYHDFYVRHETTEVSEAYKKPLSRSAVLGICDKYCQTCPFVKISNTFYSFCSHSDDDDDSLCSHLLERGFGN